MPYPQNMTLTGFSPQALAAAAFAGSALEAMRLGARVDRAAEALPETASAAIFTITGYVMVLQYLGRVATVIETQACNYSLEHNPTATGSNVALCAVLNISAFAVGTLLSLTGAVATAMASGLAVIGQTIPQILQPGTIEHKTSATNTGAVTWSCWWVPLSAGATLVVTP